MATLGERIERARIARGLSKHRLEVLAQLSKGYASRLTNDKRGERPAPSTLRRLADVLQVSYEWLAEERGDMAPTGEAVAHVALQSDMACPGRLLFVVVDEVLLVDEAWLAERREKKRGVLW